MSDRSLVVSLAAIATLAVAFATNPDERSFRDYVERSLRLQGSSWIERKVVSTVSTVAYPRSDYKFFSVVQVPESKVAYVGVFGMWFGVPL